MRNIGLQLYTVRNALKDDFIGTLKTIAAIGYRGVELAGYTGNYAPIELRAIFHDLGLQVIGAHCSIDALSASWDRFLDDLAVLDVRYVGLSWVPLQYRSASGWRTVARIINVAAIDALKHGITFFYHNHDFEFQRFDGRCGYDILFDAADPVLVKAELDVFWVRKAGEDPVAYLQKLRGRVPLVHVKDMSADANATFEVVGDGVIDFDAVFSAGDASGVDWYIVEQDQCPKGELESARRSYENIASRGWLN